MNFIRTISRAGEKEGEPEQESHTNATEEFSASSSSRSAAAVVPLEDIPAPAAALTRNNSNNDDAQALPVVMENPSEREERKEAASDPDEAAENDSECSEEEDDYEYEEDEDEAAFAGFLDVAQPGLTTNAHDGDVVDGAEPATIEEDETPAVAAAAPKWREPSREAVTMSLRAEKETSGSKRRLAQDLYRIMNKDTSETGFLLEPAVEDQMDRWKISLFQFDQDSMLAKDLKVLGLDSVELEMSFPEQYPFSPPFVRVVRPRFKRQTGFVMNGALCMELLTNDGWNPVNDIESVIVSIRSLLVVGEGRLEAAASLPHSKYEAALAAANQVQPKEDSKMAAAKSSEDDDDKASDASKRLRTNSAGDSIASGAYTISEAKAAYEHLSSYHKKKGWDQSGWWARKG